MKRITIKLSEESVQELIELDKKLGFYTEEQIKEREKFWRKPSRCLFG